MNFELKENGKVYRATTNLLNGLIPEGYLLKEGTDGQYMAFTPSHAQTDIIVGAIGILDLEIQRHLLAPYEPGEKTSGLVTSVHVFTDSFAKASIVFSDGVTMEVNITREKLAGLTLEQRFAAIMERANKMITCNTSDNG